jgi:hypothetical protein
VLRGVVVDSANGSPIGNANVLVAERYKVAQSDDKGYFTLNKMPKGSISLVVRRLGYEPQRQTIVLSGGDNDSVKVRLVAQPEVLEAMAADEGERQIRQGIEDFYVRRAQGIGTFITRQQLDQLQGQWWTVALSTVPGLRFAGGTVRFRRTPRLSDLRIDPSSPGVSILDDECAPAILYNGRRGRDPEWRTPIRPQDVEGIEVYRGATTPQQFWEVGNAHTQLCGTIVVWERLPRA